MLAGDIQVAAQIGPRVVQADQGVARLYDVFETASGNYNDFILRQDADPTRNPDLVLAIKYLFDREQMQATRSAASSATTSRWIPPTATTMPICRSVPTTRTRPSSTSRNPASAPRRCRST